MLSEPSCDYRAILRRLVSHGVEFLVVGGVAAVLHGAPYITFDLDIVHSRQQILNLDKLIQWKEQAGREKDLAALPVLRRTLEERNRR